MTDDYKKITLQFGVSYLFTILTFGLSPLLVFLLTRTLSVEEYGIYSILSGTISILVFTLMLSLNTYITTKFPGHNLKNKITAFFSILYFELIFLGIMLFLLLLPIVQHFILLFLKLEEHRFAFQFSLFIAVIDILFIIVTAYLIAERKIELQSILSFINKGLWIVLLFFSWIIFNGFNLSTVLFLWLTGLIISLALTLFYLKSEIFFFLKYIKQINKKRIKEAVSFSLPLVPVSICVFLITISDIYTINYFKDAAAVGIYTLAYSLVSIILGFSGIINKVIYPYITKKWNEKNDCKLLFNALLKYTLIIVIPATVGLFVLREQIITMVSGPKYLSGSLTLTILLLFPLIVSLNNVYNNNLLLREKTKLLAVIYLGAVFINLGLNVLLVPRYGISGAAIATVISYTFILVLFYFASWKQICWNFKYLRLTRIIAAALLMGLVLVFIEPQIMLTKILSIILGASIYILLLFLFGVFIKEEYDIMKSFLPKWVSRFLMKI